MQKMLCVVLGLLFLVLVGPSKGFARVDPLKVLAGFVVLGIVHNEMSYRHFPGHGELSTEYRYYRRGHHHRYARRDYRFQRRRYKSQRRWGMR